MEESTAKSIRLLATLITIINAILILLALSLGIQSVVSQNMPLGIGLVVGGIVSIVPVALFYHLLYGFSLIVENSKKEDAEEVEETEETEE